MKSKVLEALKAKFEGVSDAVLGRVADKLAKTTTTEDDVATAVSGVTFNQLLESYGDARATEASKTAVANYEKQHNLKDGKLVDDGQVVTPNSAGGADVAPDWAKAIIASNEALTARLNKMDGERVTASRKQQLSGVIEKLPEQLRKGYERVAIDGMSDDEFATMIADVTTEVEGIAQSLSQKGAVFGAPKAGGGTDTTGALSEAQEGAINQRDGVGADGQPF